MIASANTVSKDLRCLWSFIHSQCGACGQDIPLTNLHVDSFKQVSTAVHTYAPNLLVQDSFNLEI